MERDEAMKQWAGMIEEPRLHRVFSHRSGQSDEEDVKRDALHA